ncbi:MAG: hypothetical protein KKB20_28640 [Proteobacteria bacterium]|nr:hypothetical protein [Pseudomonadota bacterium]
MSGRKTPPRTKSPGVEQARILARVEKRFAVHGDDDIMAAIKQVTQRYLLSKLKERRDK